MITQPMQLDFWRPGPPPVVYAKQGDYTLRALDIGLYDNGQPYAIPDGYTVMIGVAKPDGHKVLNDCQTVSGNTVRAVLTQQTLAAAGTAQAEIRVGGADGVARSASFVLVIDPAEVLDDVIESSDEYKAIDAILAEVQELEAQAAAAAAEATGSAQAAAGSAQTASAAATSATASQSAAAASATTAEGSKSAAASSAQAAAESAAAAAGSAGAAANSAADAAESAQQAAAGIHDAETLQGHPASDFAVAGHTHTKAQITDFPAALPASGGNADTVDNKHASDFAVASHSHQKINRDDGQGWGVGPTGYLAPMQDGNYIANGSLGSSSYTLATMWSIFWRRNNIGVGLHPDGALAPCDADGWAATQMNLGTSNWRYGTLYLTDTVQADRLKTADATSASNAIIDANGTIRRTSGSSRRFKRAIADLPDAEADAVLELRPVRFEFKLDPPGVERNGFIAEEVLEIAPQFVDRTTLEDGTVQCDNVRYSEITAALVSIVKRQQARITAMEARITALEQA